MSTRNAIFGEISQEREYQDSKWGTKFDDANTVNDWVTYINQYASQAAAMHEPPGYARLKLLKAATLAVAALETYDRNNGFAPRHYDAPRV